MREKEKWPDNGRNREKGKRNRMPGKGKRQSRKSEIGAQYGEWRCARVRRSPGVRGFFKDRSPAEEKEIPRDQSANQFVCSIDSTSTIREHIIHSYMFMTGHLVEKLPINALTRRFQICFLKSSCPHSDRNNLTFLLLCADDSVYAN